MSENTEGRSHLSTAGASALYIGALLGPSLLLLPGLAARAAGPASLLVWLALLVLSGLIAVVFCALGTRLGSTGGVAGYTAAASASGPDGRPPGASWPAWSRARRWSA
ncbi:hypothetical protein [Kitasatospora cheerisanensis]|uniref:hypothetical protein n=1 Tax=Kitasatospora cheerisanensis TaxID=81942 RepID=UPI000AD33D66|nr:hypothetical protein [Kitasatospora cheerisanensis]